MAFERQWNAVPPVSLTADGSTTGVIQVTDTAGFYVKMNAQLTNSSGYTITVEVKRVLSSTILLVGPPKTPITTYTDCSAFTTALSSTISAAQQNKTALSMEDRMLATYEQEPVNAWREILVDSYGNHYNDTNPLPISFDGTVTIGDVTIVGPLPSGGNTIGYVGQAGGPWSQNLVEVGGSAISLGQTTMSASVPVVIASNQSALLVAQSGAWTVGRTWTLSSTTDSVASVQSGTWTVQQGSAPWSVTGSATNISGSISGNGSILQIPNGPIPSLSPYCGITLEISGAWNSTLTLIGSNGGSYYTIDVVNLSIPNSMPQSTITSNGIYYAPLDYVQLEFVSSSYVSGSVSCYASLRSIPSSLPYPTWQLDNQSALQNITVQDTTSTTTAYANNQNFITGTPTASSAASFSLSSYEAIEIQVTGTWTGTLQTEVSMDNGITWFTRGIKQTGSSYNASSFTSNFEGGMNFGGMTNVRARAVTAVTGTAIVRVNASVNPASIIVSNPLTLRDSVTQSISNTIKAANTATTATDTALVVGLSPNSSLPTGTNTLGNTNTQNDHQGNGSISIGTGSIIATTNGCSTVIFTVSGTWSAPAILIEGSVDNGVSWEALSFATATGVFSTGGFSSNNTYVTNCGGFSQVRLVPYANAWTSGTLIATWDASIGANLTAINYTLATLAENALNVGPSSNVTRVANSATSVSLLSSNPGRLSAYFYNDSSQVAYVKLGTTASVTSYTLQMAPLSFAAIDLNPVYTGEVDCIWAASGTGGMQITEIT